ncbi:pentapeptide repeat-containing protein [Scytonema sp. NUACC21]
MKTEELLQRYAAGERNFAGIELSSTKVFEDVDLRGINLSGANLNSVRIYRSNLSEARLSRASMVSSTLIDVNLSNADLNCTCLYRADWRNVNLSEAYMWGANLTKAALRNANLFFTNLEEAILVQTSLNGSTNTESVFRIHNAFIWNLRLPDGSIDEGPRFEFLEY